MRVFAFFTAIIAYAALSSSTPDQFGLAEYFVTGLLGLSLCHIKTVNAFLNPSLSPLLGFHRVFILWMMSVPLVIGTVNGHDLVDIMRDIISMALLCLPIIAPNIQSRHLIIVMAAAGGLFSARYLMIAMPNILHIGLTPAHDSLLYLANSPLVPFASIIGFSWLFAANSRSMIYRLGGLGLLAISLMSMGLMVQRAPLILTIMACLGLLAVRITHTPLKTTIIGTLLFVASIPLFGFVFQIYDGFIDKTLAVGGNNRLNEIKAIAQRSTIFGHGWGMEWQSPSVADYWVRYTHNMTAYYWLKAGIIGVVLSLIFIYVWVRATVDVVRHDIAIGFGIIVPLIIHFFLYTGYKTFDISLLLVLIILCKKDRHLF